DVVGLDVAVDQVERMGVAYAFGAGQDDMKGVAYRQPAQETEPFLQAPAIDVFHGQVMPALLFAHGETLDDVGMAEVAHAPRLTIEAFEQLLIAGHMREKDLHRYFALGAHLEGLVDGAHRPFADLADYAEVAQEGRGLLVGGRGPGRDRGATAGVN